MRSAFLTLRLTGLLLCGFFLNANAEVNPETVTASVKNVSVLEVFDIIRKQTHYSIFYDKEMLQGSKPVSVSVKDTPLADFLSLVSKDQPFTFYIEQQTIFIKKKVVATSIAATATVNISTHRLIADARRIALTLHRQLRPGLTREPTSSLHTSGSTRGRSDSSFPGHARITRCQRYASCCFTRFCQRCLRHGRRRLVS